MGGKQKPTRTLPSPDGAKMSSLSTVSPYSRPVDECTRAKYLPAMSHSRMSMSTLTTPATFFSRLSLSGLHASSAKQLKQVARRKGENYNSIVRSFLHVFSFSLFLMRKVSFERNVYTTSSLIIAHRLRSKGTHIRWWWWWCISKLAWSRWLVCDTNKKRTTQGMVYYEGYTMSIVD